MEETETEEITIIGGKRKFHDESKIYTQLSLDMKEDRTIDHLKAVNNAEDVFEIAEMIFEKENLHYAEGKVFINYPEINMTNSEGMKHTIYNVIVRLSISKSGEYVSVNFEALRGKCSYLEVRANYVHSHLETGKYGIFSRFCLGSSDFGIMLSNIRGNSTFSNWMLLLMSIEKYLAWESIEGGPHIRMKTIYENSGNPIRAEQIRNESLRLISLVPSSIIDINTLSIINGRTFEEFINEHCNIRKQTSSTPSKEDIETQKIKFFREAKKIRWGGSPKEKGEGIIEFEMFVEEKKQEEEPSVVDVNVRANIFAEINNYLTNFGKNLKHEYNKKTKHRKNYALGETKADSDRKSKEADRSPSSLRRRRMER